ncbi:MAG: heme exporter protein CcmB [Fimbriimonadaceae bacterium]
MTPANWRRQIRALLRKELLSEVRSPHGLLTGGLFSLLAVVAIMFAAYNMRLNPTLAAGLLWVILLFAGVASLPRSFIAEEENGTGDLLRLTADPHAVFWGKAIFNAALTLGTAGVLAFLFVVLMNLTVVNTGLMIAGLFGGGIALSGAVTLCGALAARAASRQALAGAIALPLVIPVAVWGVTSLRVAFGEPGYEAGRAAAIGLVAYGVVSNAVGPFIYAVLWKR